MPVKTPQDHKAKVEPFVFTGADGKKRKLPFAAKVINRDKVTGRAFRDALKGGEAGQIGILFELLDSAGLPDDVVDPLLDLPMEQTVAIIGDWLSWGDGVTASPGESQRSSTS